MKILAIVGTNAPFSYNRFLAQFIAKHYSDKADIEVKEVDKLTPFCRTEMADDTIKAWIEDVKSADGIVITTDMSANVLPGNEVLIGQAPDKFNKETGELTDEATIKQLDGMMDNFFKFVEQAHK